MGPEAAAKLDIQLIAVRKYFNQNFSLLPLVSRSKYVDARALRECGYVNLRGHPAWHSLINKPASWEILEAWFASTVRNVGILGTWEMVIFDFDDEKGYEAWKDMHPEIARQLPTQRTQRGFHILARMKGGVSTILRQPFSLVGEKKRLLGDVLGRGRYCLAWPSIHPLGVSYQWLEKQAPWDTPLLSIDRPEEIGLSIQKDRLRYLRFLSLLLTHPFTSIEMVKRKIISYMGERTDENRELFEGKG